MKGLHILAELHDCGCGTDLMRDCDLVRELCLGACTNAGLTVVGHVFHGFGTPETPAGGGVTGAVVLAESHLAVHTWPELDAVTIDLYVCNFSQDNRGVAAAAFRSLEQAFAPGHTVRRDVTRGSVDGAREPSIATGSGARSEDERQVRGPLPE